MILKFPKNFMWGSAMSALQSEGSGVTKSGKNIWTIIGEQRPEAIYGQASERTGVDSTRHYKEDLALMARYGHNSFRNSFSWARLFPDGKKPDPKAVAYYHDYLREAGKLGLKRVMSLMHFDIPGFLYETKGFLDPTYPEKFAKYAEFVFGEYGKEVEIFVTYNEPQVQIMREYLAGEGWPELKNDNQAYVDAAVAIAHSHAKAVNIFNKKYRAQTSAKISYVHAVSAVLPRDGKEFTKADAQASEDVKTVACYLLMDPMITGRFGGETRSLLKRLKLNLNLSKNAEEEIGKVKIDMVGLNYYSVTRVVAPKPGRKGIYDLISEKYNWPKARINRFRGWEIFPQGIYMVTQLVKERYGNLTSWIGENGMAVQEEWRYMDKKGFVQDDYRIAFISEHLEWLHKSIQDGANCVGYHAWSTYDCWSMTNGFKNTYGLIRVDVQTMKRFPKASALWLQGVKENNGIDEKYKKIEEVIDLSGVAAIESVSYGTKPNQKES